MILLQIRQENNFLPTSKHLQAKVRLFHGICLYECFIYRSNKCHLGSGRKTVHSKGISSYGRANQNARKLLFTDLVNTSNKYDNTSNGDIFRFIYII